ncbi:MAG: hypothetical protein ACHQD9_04860, partial [Chitinophagales bacterium]
DMFVQNTWIISLYFILRIIFQKKEQNRFWLVLFAVSLFITMYTDWLGFFFSAAIIFFCSRKILIQRNLSYLSLLIATCFVTIICSGLIGWQYSRITGWNGLVKYFTADFAIRGNNESAYAIFQSLETLAFNYGVSYFPIAIFIAIAAVRIFAMKKRNTELLSHYFSLFAWLTVFPVFLDHAIFLNYSGHDFSVLKASFFLCATGGILVNDLMKATKRFPVLKSSLLALGICVAGIIMYFFINRPGDFSVENDRYDDEMKIGHSIATHATNDEVVFSHGIEVTPQIIFYAHRNIMKITSDSEAIHFLNDHALQKGIIVSTESDSLQFRTITFIRN